MRNSFILNNYIKTKIDLKNILNKILLEAKPDTI